MEKIKRDYYILIFIEKSEKEKKKNKIEINC